MGVAVYAYNISTWKVELGELKVQGHLNYIMSLRPVWATGHCLISSLLTMKTEKIL